MEHDPHSRHLWFEAIGGLTLITVIALGFLIAVVRAEKSEILPDHAPSSLAVTGNLKHMLR
jgi:hypothetical protein